MDIRDFNDANAIFIDTRQHTELILVATSRVAVIELCADVIVSAAARRDRSKTFSKIHEKISFYPQNFLRNFISHQSFDVCR